MENINEGLTVPTWVLINQLKMPKIYLPKLFTQAQKFGVSMDVRSRAQQQNFAGVSCDIAIYLFCPYLTFKGTYINDQYTF